MSDEEAKINRIAEFITNVIVKSTGDASLRGQALNIFNRTKDRIKELKNAMTYDIKDIEIAHKSISEILENRTEELNNNNFCDNYYSLFLKFLRNFFLICPRLFYSYLNLCFILLNFCILIKL